MTALPEILARLKAEPEWVVEGPDNDKMFRINLGEQTLEMVTDDYQMACDISGEHNATVKRLRATVEALESIMNTMTWPDKQRDEYIRLAVAE